MRTTFLLVLAGLAGFVLAGCDQTQTTPVTTPNTTPPSTSPSTMPDATDSGAVPTTPDPDNTAVNERDAEGTTKTPIDQDENSADVKITAEIRQKVTGDATMSINGQNVKIVTSQGKVTLRGPVDSAAEKDAIEKYAKEVAGDANVDNQTEIAP